MYLLDVNCVVALAWPNHVHSRRMRAWFQRTGIESWATTSTCELGFVGVSMNWAVTGREVSYAEAVRVLAELESLGSHARLERTPPPAAWPVWLTRRVQGYRQVSDAGLLATAIDAHAVLATLDERILDLVDESHRDAVLCIPV